MVLICRLCLKSYPKSRPELIFSVDARDQNGLAVTTLIKTFIPEVYLGLSEDPLICHICYKTLYDAYSFRLKCLRSENLIGIYMREQDDLPTPTTIRLEDVIAYWMNMYCTKRAASDIEKENLVEWFGVHVIDDTVESSDVAPEPSGLANKSEDLNNVDETAIKKDEKKLKSVKILPAPPAKDETTEITPSNDLVSVQNDTVPKKSTNTEDVELKKILNKSKEENNSIKSLPESDPLENAVPEEGQMPVVSIKKEIVEDQCESDKLEKEAELSNPVSVVTTETTVLTPISENLSDNPLTTSEKELVQPMLKLRKVTTLKKPSRPNFIKAKPLKPIAPRKMGRQPKKSPNFANGGFLKVKSSDLQPLLLNSSLVLNQTIGEEPGFSSGTFLQNPGNLVTKPGTKMVALTLDQLNTFLKSNNMSPIAGPNSSPETVTAETEAILPPVSDPLATKPVSKDTETSQVAEENDKISEPVVKVKQEPIESSKDGTESIDPLAPAASSSDAWDDTETITGSETSLVDRLLNDEMPVLGDCEFDQPEYVSVNQVNNWEDMPILEPVLLAEKMNQVLPVKPPLEMNENLPEQSLATRIKEQIKEKMTAAKQKPVKRAAAKEPAEEPAPKKPKEAPRPPGNIVKTPEQQAFNADIKNVCVLYTNFTNEGYYVNDHDYLISPYLRNNMISYRSGRRMCICMLCDSYQPDANHVKHMKYHSTKCIICQADFKNVFILNLHVRSHTKRCFECEVNVTYARYHHHEKVHPTRVIKNALARQAEEQAEADSILKVLLAEKVDAPFELPSTSQPKRSLRSRRTNPTATKRRSLRRRAPKKKPDEITLGDLLSSSIKPEACNLDLEQLSSATQNTPISGITTEEPVSSAVTAEPVSSVPTEEPVSSITTKEPVKKTTRRKKKKFLLGRRKKSTRYAQRKIKEAPADDEFQIEYFPISDTGSSSDVRPKVEQKPVVRQKQTKRRTPRIPSPVPKVEIEEMCKDPLSLDTEEVAEADFTNIPVKSSLLFETMTPIKIVKMESNKIVVTPIGPVMTVRPTSPFQKSKKRKLSPPTSEVKPKSRFDALIEETEKHIKEARSLRKSLALKAKLNKQPAARSTSVSSMGEKVPSMQLELATQDDFEVLDKPIKQEVDPLS